MQFHPFLSFGLKELYLIEIMSMNWVVNELSCKFCRLIQVDRSQYNVTYFLNFILHFFITLQFNSRFNLICGQLRPKQDPIKKRREGKEKWQIIQPG
jgi:hypothetical protein